MINNKTILVTGSAGFIGFHIVERLLVEGWKVIGLDNLNEYYDVNLKFTRLELSGIDRRKIEYNKLVQSSINKDYSFIKLNIEDVENLESLFNTFRFGVVCNLAAQAGVRYSIENPFVYVNSNILGFTNILEQSKNYKIEHLVFASSSSVYGLNEKMPYSTHASVDHPVSLYAATKKSNELMAHVYSNIYKLPVTGLRFFTVYGPWGRPDMSPMLFADAIINNKPVKVFNFGNMVRDFTYIDDIIEGLLRVINFPATPNHEWNPLNPDPSSSSSPYRIYNIGNSAPVKLIDYIQTLEKAFNKQAITEYVQIQPGDVVNTFSDVTDLEKEFNYRPRTSIHDGIKEFANWYLDWIKTIN